MHDSGTSHDSISGTTAPAAEESRPSTRSFAGSRWTRWYCYLVMWPLFVVATATFGSAALLCSLFDGSGRIQHRIAHRWGGVLLRITGSPARVIGAENLRRCPVAVYVANHLSYMDTPVVLSRIPFQFRILARAPLFKLPFIGWYLRRSGQISVDATSAHSSLASLNGGVKVLRSGMPLVVFPEGSRSPDGRLQSFLSGPAYLAIRARVPVVPMALVGTYELMPMHTYHLQPRPLLLVAGEPISTEGYNVKMADALTARIRQEIEALHAQYSSAPEFADATGTSERSS